MALDIVSLLNSVRSLLNTANTTTASVDISANLNKRVQHIYRGADGSHEHIPVPASLYPVIFVEATNKAETLERLGNTARRDSDILINIVPITQYGQGSSSQGESFENAQLENIRLCDNLENFFRSNITLSNTVSWIDGVSTSYASIKEDDQTYNVVSIITLNLKKVNHN